MLLVALFIFLFFASVLANHKTINESNVSINRRVFAWIVVICHDIFYTLVIVSIFYSVYCSFKKKTNACVIVALNVVITVSIILFLSLNICVLTLWYNKLLGIHKYTPYRYSPSYWFSIDNSLDETGSKNYVLWTKSYLVVIVFLLLLNSWTLIQ